MPKRKHVATETSSSSSSSSALEFLTGKSASSFLADDFEKAPLHVSRKNAAYYDGLGSQPPSSLFTYRRMIDLLEEHGALAHSRRLSVMRVEKGKGRVDAPPPASGLVTSSWVSTHWKKGFTVQLYQPQIFCARIHRLLCALEAELGCVAGCSAYLTPAGKQGLAPHHDDVDVFVCQTEGSKRWKVYRPLDGFLLPTSPSGNLDASQIGPCVLDVVLQTGDLLYLPRGWVHQAISTDGGPSTHLTASVYQKHSWLDYLGALLPRLVNSATVPGPAPPHASSHLLRSALPPDFLGRAGSFAHARTTTTSSSSNSSSPQSFEAEAAEKLQLLLAHLTPELIHAAADDVASVVMRNRLPPPPPPLLPSPPSDGALQGPMPPAVSPQSGPPPTVAKRVRLIAPQYRRIVLGSQEDGEEYVMMQHCLSNSMLAAVGEAEEEEEEEGSEEDEDEDGEEGEQEDEGEAEDEGEEEEDDEEDDDGALAWDSLVFPKAASKPLFRLAESYPKWLAPASLVGDDDAYITAPLLHGLWSAGVLESE